MKTKLLTVICVLALCLAGAPSAFGETKPDPVLVITDTVIVRPLCLVATVIGSVFFVVSLPVAATSGSVHSVANSLVVSPAKATFTRPLGNMDDLIDY